MSLVSATRPSWTSANAARNPIVGKYQADSGTYDQTMTIKLHAVNVKPEMINC
jgi:hypothetical protein